MHLLRRYNEFQSALVSIIPSDQASVADDEFGISDDLFVLGLAVRLLMLQERFLLACG